MGRLSEAARAILSMAGAAIWLRRCTRVGPRARAFYRPHIDNRGQILLGARVRVNSNWAPVELASGPDGVIEIGDNVFINYGTLISAHQRVTIGSNVMIGNYCIIGDTDTPGIGEPVDSPRLNARPIAIGEGAWLAARVTVLPGARVGAGAVVAAGSIVAGDVPDGAVVGGIPAQIIRGAE